MSHAYTPARVALTTITCTDDGDPRVAASVNTPVEELADAVLDVKARVPVVSTYHGNGSPYISVTEGSPGPKLTSTVGGQLDFTGCAVGDKILVTCSLMWLLDIAHMIEIDIERIDGYGGGGASQGHVTGGRYEIDGDASPSLAPVDLEVMTTIHAVHTVTVAGTCRITIALENPTPGLGDSFEVRSLTLSGVRYPV